MFFFTHSNLNRMLVLSIFRPLVRVYKVPSTTLHTLGPTSYREETSFPRVPIRSKGTWPTSQGFCFPLTVTKESSQCSGPLGPRKMVVDRYDSPHLRFSSWCSSFVYANTRVRFPNTSSNTWLVLFLFQVSLNFLTPTVPYGFTVMIDLRFWPRTRGPLILRPIIPVKEIVWHFDPTVGTNISNWRLNYSNIL